MKPRRLPRGWLFLALCLAVLAVYAPVLRGGFLWDDDAYVAANAALRSLGGLARIWLVPGAVEQYYPLTYTVFWCEYHLWGLNTLGYHLVNVLLHSLNAFLFGLALLRLRRRGAWLAAFLFALHPVHLESVAWITELKNVLSTFLYLASLHLFLDFERSGSRRRYAASLASFAAAVLAKSVAGSLPAALLLLAWARRGRISLRDLGRLAPFLGVGLLAGSWTLWVEHSLIGAAGPAFAFSPVQRLLIASRALWFYAGKLLWPSRLAFMYPRWEVQASQWRLWTFPAAAAVLLALLWSRRARLGRWPLAAALFFGGTLVPALGLVSIYTMRFSFVADHFQYLASLGPIALFAALLSREGRRSPIAKASIAGLLFLNLALVDRREVPKYGDEAELWLDTLAKDAGSVMAHHHLGVLLARRNAFAPAAEQLEAAARLDPSFMQTQLALAYVLRKLGRVDQSLASYRRAFALGADDPQIRADFEALARARRRAGAASR